MNVNRAWESILWPQFVIVDNLNEWSPVNLLMASENPGSERSGTKHRLSSLSFLMLAMSNIVSEKFLSAMFIRCRLLRFFKYLWNLISYDSVGVTYYEPVVCWWLAKYMASDFKLASLPMFLFNASIRSAFMFTVITSLFSLVEVRIADSNLMYSGFPLYLISN